MSVASGLVGEAVFLRIYTLPQVKQIENLICKWKFPKSYHFNEHLMNTW